MNSKTTILLLLLCGLPIVIGDCISDIPYKAASKSLAAAIGDLVSSKPCKYGPDSRLDGDCNALCKGLLKAVWGDCYCENPDYQPNIGDDLVNDLSVREIYRLLATSKYSEHSHCRNWLNEEENKNKWQCRESFFYNPILGMEDELNQ